MTETMLCDPEAPLSEAAAEAYIARTCFRTGPPGQVGLELEFVVAEHADWSLTVDHRIVERRLGSLPPLPSGGSLSFEPGGQVELSTSVAPSLTSVLTAATADLAVLRTSLAADGLVLLGTGLDPLRSPHRVLHHPRYVAMERHLSEWGVGGRTMMCSTAAVQTTVEAGHGSLSGDGDMADRWDLLHAVAPALIAAFANSPYACGRRTGWKSGRQAAWQGMDPSRTKSAQRVVESSAPTRRQAIADHRETYARYALDAQVLLIRRPGGDWTAPRSMTFRDWVKGAFRFFPDLEAPSVGDLAYHLTTLFPPVRARGPLELRCLDAQAGDGWRLPPAVVSAILDDPLASDLARAAVEPVLNQWAQAARVAVADPALAKAATACLSAASDGLARQGCADVAQEVDAFIDRYTSRGRCPADDQLAWPPGTAPPSPCRSEVLEAAR